mmetsp:Transcript_75245/g.156730  ORF Transcript_75245/g.156730 Transcript_75245/m.156730 type:complete len:480 (-) Transcript_75245:197-1636(-)|eukprot:CAMPEP_0206457716 /NCGR_PEP_ID=MMETSP0324_2-20121206/23133_1 /ASSEMBLY_ACC=CAM_ASM_000836 /TAXON_ID=2866 /ORGANISM="Crypthecodinium cohnii, Strain Seligo" /LENGTH=479 /DNA_ID=CAMNT_0053928903 /DNA_START=117 /DNA_END=1556 /DNA_ORIENTATION=+
MDEKYQRIRVLGKGSFGKAYLVKNTIDDELCVVKQMETSMMTKKEKEEAVKEAMLLKRMDHKNIVRFQEVFMTRKGRLCIVMDYADGGDVHMEIKRRNGALLEEVKILEWFVQVCFALKHVHERKVLHRDLKTQNIFLMSTGQIKLGDFGIAKVLDATKDYAKSMVGTPYYLSPEIIEDRPYNFRSDIWSLGVVLYEMTTLKHPFDADSLVLLASKILNDQYPPPDAMYTNELQSLIRCMLNKDARVRPLVKEIMAKYFLRAVMLQTIDRYNLGIDLSDVPCEPPEAAAPCALEGAGSAEASMNTTTISVGVPADDGDSEYDEDFEDYDEEEEEDHGQKPQTQTDLERSVANLKIGNSGPSSSSAAATAEGGGDGAGGEEGAAAMAPQEQMSGSFRPNASASGTVIGAKADALRTYLQSKTTDVEFSQTYNLVRASGEESGEEVLRMVTEIIGTEKAQELLKLFQLLCFLEDVAKNPSA